MKTVTARDLQKQVKECVDASQQTGFVVTCRGKSAAVLVGVQASDWERWYEHRERLCGDGARPPA